MARDKSLLDMKLYLNNKKAYFIMTTTTKGTNTTLCKVLYNMVV